MKSVKNIWEKITTVENIEDAFYEASKGKRNREDVKRVLENIDHHVIVVRDLLIGINPDKKNSGYMPKKAAKQTINEGTRKKVRNIDKPKYKYDQVIHHAVMRQLIPIIIKSSYAHVCGSIPKRGSHSAKKKIEQWIKSDSKNTKYCAKLDIRHFYESVDHEILKSWLKKKISDKCLLEILNRIIDSHVDKVIESELVEKDHFVKTGIPLGFYTSGWFGNWLLQPLDFYIKHELKAKYYVRYMDDIVILGSNKRTLHKNVENIEKYLNKRLNLKMKYNHQVFLLDWKEKGRPLDFMGFMFYRNRTTLRKTIMMNKPLKPNKKTKKTRPSIHDCSSMVSYMGYISHTETYNVYVNYVKPKVNIRLLKKRISANTRKEHSKNGIQKDTRITT